ncbi:MAG: hypothetical protein IT215_08035, partial [Chitinophagaceae bacterium]|nr:hypothetical protein [Chitinophagaceae bacterium]
MKKILITFISFFTIIPYFTFGQLSNADSTFFNSIFTEQPYISYWNYPGNWYHRSEPSSLNNLYEQIDSNFVFYNEEYIDCYPKIKVNNILERDTLVNQSIDDYEDVKKKKLYGTRSPFVKLKYELNGKTAYAYAALDSSTKAPYDTDVAYVIFSGTGANGIAEIIAGTGYHNDNCKILNNLKPKGDVYVLNCPNEEQRAIIFNKKKLASTSNYSPPFLISYLNAENKALGITRLIESAAMIKFLKTKYKRVYVLGLSTGGKVALWVTMISSPDASLISSGYSILVDNDYNSQIINNLMYSTYLKILDKDSTKNRIKQLNSQILFTLPQNDAPIAQLDIDSQYTKNFYSDVGNTSFFYNYTKHAFPPCNTIDTFFERCNAMAKVFLSVDTNLCNKDSLILNINFQGQKPFTYQVYNQNNLIGNYACSSNDTSITLYNEGKYVIKNIIDSFGTLGYFSDTIYYTKTVPPTLTVSSQEWLCDSLKQKIIIEAQGEKPFMIHYTKGNQNDSITFNTLKDSIYLSNNQYHFYKISDASNCYIDPNIPINISDVQTSTTLTSVEYNCLLDKNKITLTSEGKFPMQLYFYDSIHQANIIDTFFNSPYVRMLDSGVYYLSKVIDNNQCSVTMDSVLQINSNPIYFTSNQPTYECFQDYSILPIKLNGTPPLSIFLEHNGIAYSVQKNNYSDTLHLQKGITKFSSVKDGNGCTFNLNNITFNNTFRKTNASVSALDYDCNQQQRAFQLITEGNYPITVYGKNSIDNIISKTLYDTTLFWAKSGDFQIDSIVDNNNCQVALQYKTTVTNDTSSYPLNMQGMDLVSDAVSSKNYIWYFNGKKWKETDIATIPILQNGVYQMAHYNANNCLVFSPNFEVELDDLIVYPNPLTQQFSVFINIYKKDKVTMKIINSIGKEISSYQLKDGRNDFIFPSEQKGVY